LLAIWLITGCMTILIRLVPVVEQELHTLLEHLSSPPVFRRVCAIRSLVLYVCFVNRCLSFCPFYFGHCVVCSSSIYRLWLPLCYLPMNAIWNIENLENMILLGRLYLPWIVTRPLPLNHFHSKPIYVFGENRQSSNIFTFFLMWSSLRFPPSQLDVSIEQASLLVTFTNLYWHD
jgi:hypothetical protein